MCTVSILRHGDGVRVTMNRDEARTRAPELPIQTFSAGDLAWLAPVDSEASGTWMGLNSAGLVACLLNVYGAENEKPVMRSAGKKSRGTLVMDALRQGSFDDACRWVETSVEPDQFMPFRLALVSVAGASTFRWTGDGTVISESIEDEALLVSSSWHPEAVRRWREERFAAWVNSGRPFVNGIPAFHLSSETGSETYSVMMARELSCTRSVTQADIGGDPPVARLRYWPVVEGVLKGPGTFHDARVSCPVPSAR